MTILTVTNNPLVKEAYEEKKLDSSRCVDLRYVDGSAETLLLTVRDMVHEGFPLLTHPLAASIRMLYSPYRSVLLGADAGAADPWHTETAEESLRKYRLATGHRTPDTANAEEYQWIDMQLLLAALKEPLPFI